MNKFRKTLSHLLLVILTLAIAYKVIEAIQKSMIIDYDPDVERITGTPIPAPKPSALNTIDNAFIKAVRLFISPPEIKLGFQEPPADFQKGIHLQKYVQAVVPFNEREWIAPIRLSNAPNPGSVLSGAKTIYTSEPMALAGIKWDGWTVRQMGPPEVVLEKVAAGEAPVGLIPYQILGEDFRAKTGPVPLRYWVGWKENKNPLFQYLDINGPLYRTVENLMDHQRMEYRSYSESIAFMGNIHWVDLPPTTVKEKLSKISQSLEPLQDYIFPATIQVAPITGPTRETPTPNAAERMNGLTETLRYLSVDVGMLANAEILAKGKEDLEKTLYWTKEAGTKAVGAGFNHVEAQAPHIRTTPKGLRVAFLSYSNVLPRNGSARINQAGINPLRTSTMKLEVRKVKKKADLVFVLIDWGAQSNPNPSNEEKGAALAAINAGADGVIGFNRGPVRRWEWYKGKPIIYGLGEFLNFEEGVQPSQPGLLLRLDYIGQQLMQVRLEPFQQTAPNLALGEKPTLDGNGTLLRLFGPAPETKQP